ncbi:MAG: hypothetical protein IJY28_09175 [Clostridia bacterium]|nr:hypothetical protein [Clostridia bacterium]
MTGKMKKNADISRQKMLWFWTVLCLASGVITAAHTYTHSPAHEAIRSFDEESICRFEQIYAAGVEDSEFHRWIFNRKMLNRFDEEFDRYYEVLHTADDESLPGYITRTEKLLRACQDPILTEDIRQKFDALAAEVYAHYPDSEQAYSRARDIMGRIVGSRYCSEQTKADYAFLLEVGKMEQQLSAGKHYESKEMHYDAIKAYRQAVEHPRYGAEAQAAADRCLAAFRTDMLTDLRSKAAADMNRTWAQLQKLWELLPDDEELQQICTQFDRYMNHGLYAYVDNEADNARFTRLFQNSTDGSTTVTDASGKEHDIFNLYKLQANPMGGLDIEIGTVQLAAYMKGHTGITRLTFTVDPSAACGDGWAVIEVYGKAHASNRGGRPYYTSPRLTKDSATLTVDIKMDYEGAAVIKLVCYDSPMEILIDNAYVEGYRP